ncbi:MAG: TIGR01777 family oxidoreductase [Lacibacter sp.]
MEIKKIIVAGGSGFIGEELIRYFGKKNHLVILTRKIPSAKNNRNEYSELTPEDLSNTTYVEWDGKTVGNWKDELEDADIIINLAGKTVNCRYTEKNKKEIIESRINATKAIGEAIQHSIIPPKLWINASSATIYRHAADRPQDEYTGEIKNDFSVEVCKQWEKTFYEQATSSTRKIALRMAITIGAGGVMIPYFNLLKFGLGGKQGSGKQMYSWVHIEDSCRMIEWLYEHKELEGTFNCSSPYPVTNTVFMKTLREVTNTRFGLPAFEWMLKLGALMIGTEAELVLKSRWVIPTKISESGFQFKYGILKDALQNVITNTPPKQYRLFH